jgi:DNA-directed RNA polymerase subunit RPC12/RpoP
MNGQAYERTHCPYCGTDTRVYPEDPRVIRCATCFRSFEPHRFIQPWPSGDSVAC